MWWFKNIHIEDCYLGGTDENILVELDLGFSLNWVNGFQITTEEDVVVLFIIVSHLLSLYSYYSF